MKNLLIIAALAFIPQNPANSPLAVVRQIDGLYVFTDCKPADDYAVLGVVYKKFSMSGFYREQRKALIAKAKENYPTANGIIISETTDSAEAILLQR